MLLIYSFFYAQNLGISIKKTKFVHNSLTNDISGLMKNAASSVNIGKLEISSEILRALAHPLRMQILEYIDQHKTVNVNKIYNNLSLEQSITSQHLKTLRSAGLVHAYREGKMIHYTIDYDKLHIAVKAVNRFLEK
jgi:DNA-binding transcriptional ArsR family regulator